MSKRHRTDKKYASELDANDPLRKIRDRFYLNPNEIYMDGNSLGLLSKDAEQSLLRVLSEWKTLGINGWSQAEIPWFYYAEELAKQQAHLVGAKPEEVILHSSTTVNIHALIASFYAPDKKKNKILIEENSFPTDRYAVESQIALKGFQPETQLKLVKRRDNGFLEEKEIIEAMTDDVALVFLPSVLYRSGQLLDMEMLTQEAHVRGILIGFDCAHSVGVVPHSFSKWGLDFACWCNYKYCNSGPGGVAGLYINKKHFVKKPALAGWFGSDKQKQFDMSLNFEPAKNAGAWQMGTPHILSLAPLEGSLKIMNEVGIHAIRKKSLALTEYLMFLINHELAGYGFEIGTPGEPERRGGHVALLHEYAVQINEAMKAESVIADFRFPNLIRLAPVALYSSFVEIWRVVKTIRKIMETKSFLNYKSGRGIVA